jgi:hypothetical protein
MNEDKIKNYLKKIFIVNIIIMALFIISEIIITIQYKTINNLFDDLSINVIWKISYGISVIVYIKIIRLV